MGVGGIVLRSEIPPPSWQGFILNGNKHGRRAAKAPDAMAKYKGQSQKDQAKFSRKGAEARREAISRLEFTLQRAILCSLKAEL